MTIETPTQLPSPLLARAFAPWTLGPLPLRNRFIKSATNEGMAPGGVPTRALVEHHRAIAAGGVGMTTVAYCAVSADGRTFVDQVTLDEVSLPHLRALTDAVHREGAAICAQITHGGAFNFLPELSTGSPLSASGGFNAPGVLSGRLFKAAMGAEDLARVGDEFAAAARLAQRAGFDAVEIHMGHGYLLSQFLSPKYNRRRDAWGGDALRRTRFPVQVLSKVLDAVGDRMAVQAKLSSFEGFKGGGTVDDAVVACRAMADAGAHLLVLSAGMNVESPWTIFGSRMPKNVRGEGGGLVTRFANRWLELMQPDLEFSELYLMEAARSIRQRVAAPLAYLGGVTSVQGIETAMQGGFDAVVLGRALIHDAAFLDKIRRGMLQRSACDACNHCVSMMYTAAGTHCVMTAQPDVDLNRQPAARI